MNLRRPHTQGISVCASRNPPLPRIGHDSRFRDADDTGRKSRAGTLIGSRDLLKDQRESERGAIAVLVALLLVVLLGFAAVAVDIGLIAWTRTQLQTGADAAALAIAQDCAKSGTTACQSTAPSKAQTLTAANIANGNAAADTPVFPAPATVTVHVSARDKTGPGLQLGFAQVLGIPRTDVDATATAAWGSPYAGTASIPLAFSECQFNLTGTPQLLQYAGGPTCSSSSNSGHTIPGGFGWLKPDTGVCRVAISLAHATITSKPGKPTPQECSSSDFMALIGQTVLLPVFDDAGSQGANGWFHIKGFAAFQLTGYNFPGKSYNNNQGAQSCTGNCAGVIGQFVRFVSLDNAFTPGGPDLGAELVRLTH